jgi:hypothetical protein
MSAAEISDLILRVVHCAGQFIDRNEQTGSKIEKFLPYPSSHVRISLECLKDAVREYRKAIGRH